MNTSWTPIKTALTLALCGVTLAWAPGHAAGQTTGASVTAPAAATAAGVRPGDDFFAYANSAWLNQTEIPADRGSWSAMGSLAEDTNARIVKLIEDLASDKNTRGEGRMVANYYSAFMNQKVIESNGTGPLKPLLAKIDAIKDKAGLTRVLGESVRADVDPLNNTKFYTENLFGLWVAQGLSDSTRNQAYLLQGGLGMPDRAYFLDASARMAELRTAYQAHIAATLKLAGLSEPEKRAARVFALEMAIAGTHAPRDASNDIQKSNNTWTPADFAAKAPGLDWTAFFAAAKLQDQASFGVWHPGAMTGAAALLARPDLQAWKDYLSFHLINHHAAVLPKAFQDQSFAFNGKTLSGAPQQALRWKQALAATNGALDDAVGKIYVGHYFPAANKVALQKMVANIVAAFGQRIDKLDWMAPATRAQAKEKLRTLYVGVGYPDHWKTYTGLTVSPIDAFGNAVRAEEFHYANELALLHSKPNRTDWTMPPQLVNAVNLPLQNALNFPAAILQPPFYDPKASDAANYGAIGAIIGHEISHSFDDQGAQFDAEGHLRDWWTTSDLEHFQAASGKLVAQYNAYKPFPDLAVNGQLTLSENLADLAGLAASYDAFKAASNAGPAADRDFFLGFAQAWRSKFREPSLRRGVLTDGHAPAMYRAATVRNLDAWYGAFDVQPGQQLYLAPEQRVRVW